MSLPVCLITPVQDGYGVSAKASATLTDTEGGKPRVRSRTVGGSRLYAVTWALSAQGWAYLDLFYRVRTQEGGLPFQVNLFDEEGVISAYQAVFVPGSFSLRGKDGGTLIAGAQLDAFRINPVSTGDAEDYLDYVEALGSVPTQIDNVFDGLVNAALMQALS